MKPATTMMVAKEVSVTDMRQLSQFLHYPCVCVLIALLLFPVNISEQTIPTVEETFIEKAGYFFGEG